MEFDIFVARYEFALGVLCLINPVTFLFGRHILLRWGFI